MIIGSEREMLVLGHEIASRLSLPAVIELVGDVGTGKTTFTRGLAVGLGIAERVTSPSFTISKRYPIPADSPILPPDSQISATFQPELIHYDFYRLPDPGIMRDELLESLENPAAVVVIEWGNSVADLLPRATIHIQFVLNEDGTRTAIINWEKTA